MKRAMLQKQVLKKMILFDGKTTNSTDDIVKAIKESKEKISVMIKLNRNGKSMNIETKMPRKIKTADL